MEQYFSIIYATNVLNLLLVHNRSHMLLAISKYIDKYEIKGEGRLADNAGYYEAIKMNNVDVMRVIVHANRMNNVDVLRVIVHTNRMNEGVTKYLDFAFYSRSYESLDFLIHYHGIKWDVSSTLKLENGIKSGNIDFYI